MHKEPDKKRIGLFMVTGISVLLIIFGIYLKGKVFTDTGNILVMYFEESIRGLNVGSSVVFKGVEIGKVAKINLIADAKDLNFRIPVYVKLEAKQSISSVDEYYTKQTLLDELIKKGLRARLTSQSYLTGQLMIELEMLPDTPIILHPESNVKGYLEIPTALSSIGEISRGIQNIPIKESVENFNKFFAELNKHMPTLLPRVQEVVTNVNTVVTDNTAATSNALDNLNRTLVNVNEAAKALRNFADYLERHPEALLKGKGGY